MNGVCPAPPPQRLEAAACPDIVASPCGIDTSMLLPLAQHPPEFTAVSAGDQAEGNDGNESPSSKPRSVDKNPDPGSQSPPQVPCQLAANWQATSHQLMWPKLLLRGWEAKSTIIIRLMFTGSFSDRGTISLHNPLHNPGRQGLQQLSTDGGNLAR